MIKIIKKIKKIKKITSENNTFTNRVDVLFYLNYIIFKMICKNLMNNII